MFTLHDLFIRMLEYVRSSKKAYTLYRYMDGSANIAETSTFPVLRDRLNLTEVITVGYWEHKRFEEEIAEIRNFLETGK